MNLLTSRFASSAGIPLQILQKANKKIAFFEIAIIIIFFMGVRFKPDSCLPAGGAPDTARECSFFVRKLDQSFISMISKYLVTFRRVSINSDIELYIPIT